MANEEETKPDMPPQPKTVQLPAADRAEIQFNEMKALFISGINALDAKVALGFRNMTADVSNVASAVDVLRDRVNLHDRRFEDNEQRLNSNSMRAQVTSSIDLDHEAKIAANIIKTNELEAVIHDTKALAIEASEELRRQSNFMGMGKQGLKWVASKEGRQTLTQVAVVIGVFYGILKSSGVVK